MIGGPEGRRLEIDDFRLAVRLNNERSEPQQVTVFGVRLLRAKDGNDAKELGRAFHAKIPINILLKGGWRPHEQQGH